MKQQGRFEVPKWADVVKTGNNFQHHKIMVFEKVGSKFSMHFHKEKDETWFVNGGKFKVRWIDTKDATVFEKELKEGDTWHNPPLQPHQLEALEPMSSITEVSTPDSVEDNYRLIPGDSQSLTPEEIDG